MEEKSNVFLNTGELIVLKFSCHLIVNDIFQDVFVPALLYLTNKRVFIESTIDSSKVYSIPFKEIIEIERTKSLDYFSFVIRALTDVSIMVDFEHIPRFISIIKTLTESSLRSGSECDYYSHILKNKFEKAGNIQRFIQSLEDSHYFMDDKLVIDIPITHRMIRHFDILREVIEIDEFVIFAILFLISSHLNLLFHFMNFGAFICGSGFLFLVILGFHVIFSKTVKIEKDQSNVFNDEQKNIHYYIDNFQKRIFWKIPKKTLDVALFLFSGTLLFSFCDPFIVLGISLIAMSFVEKWDPFGFGSFPEIISNFFSF